MRDALILGENGEAELFPELYEVVCRLACEVHQRNTDSLKGSKILGELVVVIHNPRISGCLNGLEGWVFNAGVELVGERRFITFLVSNERLERERVNLSRGEDITDKVL